MRTTEGRRRGLSAVLLVLAIVATACGDSGTTAPPPGGAQPVATVSIDPTTLVLVVGDSVRLQVVLKDAQGRVLEEYDRLVDEYGLQVVDARGTITEQQQTVRRLVSPFLMPAMEIRNEQPGIG